MKTNQRYEIVTKAGAVVGRYSDRSEAIMKSAARRGTVVRVAKAAKSTTAQVAVYDAKGNLVGTVDPDNIVELADAPSPDGADKPVGADAVDASQLQPAPAGNAGVAVAKARDLHRRITKAATVAEREQLQNALMGGASAALAALHAGTVPGRSGTGPIPTR